MCHGLEHEPAEVHEVVRADCPGGEVSAGRTQYGKVETVLDGQYSEDAVCTMDERSFLSSKSTGASVGHVTSDYDEQGYGQYQK